MKHFHCFINMHHNHTDHNIQTFNNVKEQFLYICYASECTVRTGDVTPTAYAAGLAANMAAPIDLIIECSNASFVFILNITIK